MRSLEHQNAHLQRKVVKAVIFDDSSFPPRILVQREPQDPSVTFPGKLNIPGGKVKSEEELKDFLRKIVSNETGLLIKSPEHAETFDEIVAGLEPAEILVYVCNKWEGIPKPNVLWLSLEDLRASQDVPPEVKYVIENVLEGRLIKRRSQTDHETKREEDK